MSNLVVYVQFLFHLFPSSNLIKHFQLLYLKLKKVPYFEKHETIFLTLNLLVGELKTSEILKTSDVSHVTLNQCLKIMESMLGTWQTMVHIFRFCLPSEQRHRWFCHVGRQ